MANDSRQLQLQRKDESAPAAGNTIRNTVCRGVVISFGMMFITGMLLFWSMQRMNRATENGQLADNIMRNIFEKTTLRNEYLLHFTERARIQWEQKHEYIGKLLQQAEKSFPRQVDREAITDLNRNHEAVHALFMEIARKREALPEHARQRVPSGSDAVLADQLLLKSYRMISAAILLKESSERMTAASQRAANIFLGGFIVVVMLTTSANLILVYRTVRQRIAALQQETTRITAGDYAHRLTSDKADELRPIVLQINELAARLAETSADGAAAGGEERTLHQPGAQSES